MRTLAKACCLFLILLLVSFAPQSGGAGGFTADREFDVYGAICWELEKAHLDNFAVALQQDKEYVGYIIVYAGRLSCEGEAKFRGERAKKWVVKRGIEPERVVVMDAGYWSEAWTRLSPRDKSMEKPEPEPGLDSHEVFVSKDCKGKIYLPVECPGE
ncbi:MAG TPA: hypothetical protein VGC87_05710 [Pyrinomonadaceae bacterium]|jgi:hypothetical protein